MISVFDSNITSSVETAKVLIKNGANIYLQDNNSNTALIHTLSIETLNLILNNIYYRITLLYNMNLNIIRLSYNKCFMC